MQTNYRYLLDHAAALTKGKRGARVLDYGCGAGQVVRAGRARGLDIYGADVFYGGNNVRHEVQRAGLLGTVVREIRDGRLDFENEFFDVVVSNQVFEHVEDLDAVLREIHRVMKHGGVLLSLFPSREVIREGHIGIPLAHRFRKDSRMRYLYVLLMRTLGLGYYKEQADSRADWARKKLQWIDQYTHYRKRKELFDLFRPYFEWEDLECDHIRYRLADRRSMSWLRPVVSLPLVRQLGGELYRRLGGLVVLARRAA